jgi:hypothetical protein
VVVRELVAGAFERLAAARVNLEIASCLFQPMPKSLLEPVLGTGCTLCFLTWKGFLAREVHTPKSREAYMVPLSAARSRSLDLHSAPVALPFVGPASTPEFFELLPPAPRGTKRFNRSRDFPGRFDRQGTADNRRKSALRAWYAAADRLPSEPHMTTTPSVVETNHLHARPRLRTVVSKTRN